MAIIDVDLAKFFDTIDHELLLRMLREKINDPKFLRYVQRMFKSGVLAEGELRVGDEGVPRYCSTAQSAPSRTSVRTAPGSVAPWV